jgi:hypothetical protein
MRIKRIINIFILISIAFQLKAQNLVPNKMIEIEFQTIEKKSNDNIIASVIEIKSNGERIGIIHGDYDGISNFKVCSKKIKNGKITLNVYGIKCKPFQKTFKVEDGSKIIINLNYGETKYKTLEDRKYILAQLNIPICDIEICESEKEVIYYKHCDGRIKNKNEIPDIELFEWERIEK